MADIKPDQAHKELMSEYFIRMDALKKHVFPNVELRGSGNLFNQLTITLDRVLVGAFDQINPGRKACSINLNVESVFTKAFETFLGEDGGPSLNNMVSKSSSKKKTGPRHNTRSIGYEIAGMTAPHTPHTICCENFRRIGRDCGMKPNKG
ncbi:MAG TPA: hypothetical protein EYQ81_14175, partial [Sneathiellales bacterium]|nr:hypothetical protein [Sneathiellales bacterium]